MKKILFVLGTAREGRKSERVARYVMSIAEKRTDIQPIFVDVKDYMQSHTKGLSNNATDAWNTLVKDSHGMVIISPEYNHGYPGELKMLLDSAYEAYEGKPVAICGVSDGPIGGARMAEQLKLVLSAFQMMIINAAVYFAKVNDLFDESGTIVNAEYWDSRVQGMLDQVVRYVHSS